MQVRSEIGLSSAADFKQSQLENQLTQVQYFDQNW